MKKQPAYPNRNHPGQGLVLNRHTLADYTHREDAGSGTYSYGVALFSAPEGEWHSHVVWNLIWNHDDEKWVTEGGTYCHGLKSALAAYEDRGGVIQ